MLLSRLLIEATTPRAVTRHANASSDTAATPNIQPRFTPALITRRATALPTEPICRRPYRYANYCRRRDTVHGKEKKW